MKVWRQISGMRKGLKVTLIFQKSPKVVEPGTSQRSRWRLEYLGAKEHRDPKREYSVLSNEGETMMDICGELPSCQTSFHAEF